ncbi:MAG: hypothetical protein ABIA78_02700 [archaeon]
MTDEHQIKNSFRAVKADILKIEGELMNIKSQLAQILQEIEHLKSSSRKKVSRKK